MGMLVYPVMQHRASRSCPQMPLGQNNLMEIYIKHVPGEIQCHTSILDRLRQELEKTRIPDRMASSDKEVRHANVDEAWHF